MNKKSKLVLLLVTVAVIFLHSMMGVDLSSEESGFVTRVLTYVLSFVFRGIILKEAVVRKIAHFLEYLVLSLVSNNYFSNFKISLQHDFVIAFLDETIQIFSKRGPAIIDVWIDFSGALVGTVIFLIVKGLVNGKKGI